MCPRTPPTQTPPTSLIPARTIVASWDLSPHSAMKVMLKQFTNSLKIFRHFLPNQEFSRQELSITLSVQFTVCFFFFFSVFASATSDVSF